jgi:hypothetical protein
MRSKATSKTESTTSQFDVSVGYAHKIKVRTRQLRILTLLIARCCQIQIYLTTQTPASPTPPLLVHKKDCGVREQC